MADNNNTRALLQSNAKWAADVSEADPDFFPDSAKNLQTPHSLWIGCADSRVAESVITASKPGAIFVHRNIANQFPADDNNVLSVLAYAVNYLGVENVIIVGHTQCGGAAASLNAAQAPNFVPKGPIITVDGEPVDSPLNRWLEPLTLLAHSLQLPDNSDKSIETLVKENVKAQVENLANTETIRKAWTQGTPKKQKVFIHGWIYDLGSGLLKDLGLSRGPPE